MKTYLVPNLPHRIPHTAALSLLVLSLASTLFAGPSAKEKFVVATNVNTIEFPPRAEGMTDTLTVSSPSLIIEEGVASRLGGAALAKMARPSLENLLNNSGRFTVLLDGEAPYKIIATVTSLKISQAQTKKGATASKLLKSVIPGLIKTDDKFDSELMAADWSKDEVVMKVECGVTVQLMDKDSRLVAGHTGVVSREDKTATLRAELGGITFGNGAAGDSNGNAATTAADTDIPTRLIELAAYDSLKQSLPAIDRELTQRKTAPPTEKKTVATVAPDSRPLEKEKATIASNEPQAVSNKRFCGQCGQKLDGDDKFCPNCGKLVLK